MSEPALEPLLRYWRAHDELFGVVEPTWWGAVVGDERYPALNEMNYARVETTSAVDLADVEETLLPSLARGGVRRAHVVAFHPEEQTDLLVQASSRGDRITWDVLMEHTGLRDAGDPRIEESRLDAAFWSAHRVSLEWFDVKDDDVARQLRSVERDILVPGGRRWFTGTEDGTIVALAALLVLNGVAYVDHVATDPAARRRGFATALTRRLVCEATATGAERTYLLADPGGAASAMYERIGFRAVTQIASWSSDRPIPA
jgi:ribosomal protein S18 acetylase RimI-like enzyme